MTTGGRVLVDITTSLDGFITGPNASVDNPLGDGGERLHQWVYELTTWRERHGLTGGKIDRDAEILDEAFKAVGATVMGRRMFDEGEGPWGDNPPFHAPVFVLTHAPRQKIVKQGGTTFTFVTDGMQSALTRARAAAGGKDVTIAGGANTIQQFLVAGLLDELQIHIAPVLLGDGIRLFERMAQNVELELTRVIDSPRVTHLKYRIAR